MATSIPPFLARIARATVQPPLSAAGGHRVVTDRRQLARIPWRRLSTRPVYENGWIRVREDQVAMPDGETSIYGVVECGGCVGVLPFLNKIGRASCRERG